MPVATSTSSNARTSASTATSGPSRTRLGVSSRRSTRNLPAPSTTVALLDVPPLSRPTATHELELKPLDTTDPDQAPGHRHDIPAVEARLLGPLEVVRDDATSLAISAARCAGSQPFPGACVPAGQHAGELVEADRVSHAEFHEPWPSQRPRVSPRSA